MQGKEERQAGSQAGGKAADRYGETESEGWKREDMIQLFRIQSLGREDMLRLCHRVQDALPNSWCRAAEEEARLLLEGDHSLDSKPDETVDESPALG